MHEKVFDQGTFLGTGAELTDAQAARFAERLREVEPYIRGEIRMWREERGWSQARLAAELGRVGLQMDQPTIARIEKGSRTIRVEELWALAVVFQVPLETFLVFSTTTMTLEELIGSLKHDIKNQERKVEFETEILGDMQEELRKLEARRTVKGDE